LYLWDSHSPSAAASVKAARLPLLITEFGEFELVNAIGLSLFRKDAQARGATQALRLFHEDIRAGVLQAVPIPSGAFSRASQISEKYTPQLGTRTLDVLHAACAIAMNADAFYTFDCKQAQLASAVGLRVR
jgi:predicted nucleic acid-binding protein